MILGFEHEVQLWVFIKAVGTGYLLGMYFCIFMLINASGGKRAAFVFIRDILFFVPAAFISFMLMLKYCSGMIRFYVLAGELMGFILFRIFPGSAIAAYGRSLFSSLKKRVNKNRKKMKKIAKNT